MKTRNRFRAIFAAILKSIFYLVCILSFSSSILVSRLAEWFSKTFTISFREVIFTVKSPLKGAKTDFLKDAVAFVQPRSIAAVCALLVAAVAMFEFFASRVDVSWIVRTKRKTPAKISLYPIAVLAFAGFVAFSVKKSVSFADEKTKFSEYLSLRKVQTKIYDEKYVRPTAEIVTRKGKNLISIYMESMETTYASKAVGGKQDGVNYIPRLTELAEENVNFSQNGNLGGFRAISGAGWTMGALFATSTGCGFHFPTDGNSMDKRSAFASGITAIGDILNEKGYSQEFLCGSDGNFAGRKQFFEQHGGYSVFDLSTAREKEYIPPDYHVWWGYEDEILYRIAKDELRRLSSEGRPFNFTMLTVDTHHVGGYRCQICGDEYEENLCNVVRCADSQVYDFVRWCQEQDFYEDTLIVITGDHPRMDSILVDGVEYGERTVYNCFINSAKIPKRPAKNRECTTVDMFPSVLSAMGFSIEGNRLGFGTDLFSETPTQSEEMGYDEFNSEQSKFSEFYIDNFS